MSPGCGVCNATDVHPADLDGDGDDDVLVASKDDNKIAWYENLDSGDVSTQQNVITTGAFGVADVHTADLDGDGDQDVIAAQTRSNNIAWYENLDSGGFSSGNSLPTAVKAKSVATGDLDNDGDPDIVTASSTSTAKVVWIENQLDNGANADFSSENTVSTNTGDADVEAVSVVEIKGGDNYPEIVIAGDKVVHWKNDTGSFINRSTTTESDARDMCAADFDDDGDRDVAVIINFGADIVWYENQNTGSISTAQTIASTGGGTLDGDAESIAAALLDGDTKNDILYTTAADQVEWAEFGSTSFFAPASITSSALGTRVVAAADVTGNGNPDPLSGSSTDEVDFYQNTGGTFDSKTVISPVPFANEPNAIATADFTGDGRPEVLSISEEEQTVSWFANQTGGAGGFVPESVTTITTDNFGFNDVHAADLSGDGTPDALAAGGTSTFNQDGGVFWNEYIGGGDGFSSTRNQIITPKENPFSDVDAADLDADGDVDVVAASQGEGDLYWALNDSGTFPSNTAIPLDLSTEPIDIHPANVGGDSKPDLIAALSGTDDVVWLENQIGGAGGFSDTTRISENATNVQDVHAADLDGDGDPDVLSASPGDNKVAWYENLDSGGFGNQQVISSDLTEPTLVRTADLDGDGNPDVVARGKNAVVGFENQLDSGNGFLFAGTLATRRTTTSTFVSSIALADVDDDGKPDGLIANSTFDHIFWYKNDIQSGDGSPPDVTLSNPDNLPAPGENTSVSVTFPDDFTPTSATLVYAPATTGDVQSIGLDLASLSASQRTLSVQIPGSVVTERGVQYFLETEGESVSPFTVPSTAPTNTAHLPAQLSDIQADGAFEPNTYRMLTVPVGFRNRSAFEALEGRFGSYDAARWRLGRWAASDGAYRFGPEITPLNPGEAAWVITSDGRALAFEEALSPEVTGPVPITLQSGWNQIGSPFRFPVAWADVQKPASVRTPVAYDPSKPKGDRFQFGASTLEPWDGVFVYNEANEAVTIRVPPKEASLTEPATASTLAAPKGTPSGYRLQAIATLSRNGQRLQDRKTWLGFSGAATEGFGPKDRAKPPAVGNYVRLYAMPESGPGLARSLRPKPDDGAAWDLQLQLHLDDNKQSTETVTVQLAEQGSRPDGFQRYVIDRDRNRRLPVTNQSVQVPVQPNESARRLRVVVGTEAFAKQHSDGAALAVSETKLLPNAPNPFSTSTTLSYQLAEEQPVTIAIYDLLGRRVTTLVNGPRASGVYQIEWQPEALSSGVYFCRMEAGSYTESQKLVLVR